MGVYELPIATNNGQKRLLESLQYKKYFVYKRIHSNNEELKQPGKYRKIKLREFKKPLLHYKKKYIQQFDRPLKANEEWYPKKIIEDHNNDENTEDVRDEESNSEQVPSSDTEGTENREFTDLTFHEFNRFYSHSYIKQLRKKNRAIMLATTSQNEREYFDKAYIKASKDHYKTEELLTSYSENTIIKNNFKLQNVSNIMQIWHTSILQKNWTRAYRCMSLIIRIENVEITQIYSMIIVTLQNADVQNELKNNKYKKDSETFNSETLSKFLKWAFTKYSPLVRVNLNRTQTDRYPFFNRIKTFNTIPHVIYFYFYYNIINNYKSFMDSQSKRDYLKFNQFLGSIEELMLSPPFQGDFIFNYYIGICYLMLVDFNSILMKNSNDYNNDNLIREANLNLNKSMRYLRKLGIDLDDRDYISNDQMQKNTIEHIYHVNSEFIADQINYLKNKLFGKDSAMSSSSEDSSFDDTTNNVASEANDIYRSYDDSDILIDDMSTQKPNSQIIPF